MLSIIKTFYNVLCNIIKVGLSGFVTAVRDRGAQGVIIDCSVAALSVGLLASQWNIPVVGFSAGSVDLSDKNIYNTFVRVVPTLSSLGYAVLALCIRYNWTTVGIMAGETNDPNLQNLLIIYQGIAQILAARNISFKSVPIGPKMDPTEIGSVLKILSSASRSTLIIKFKYRYH